MLVLFTGCGKSPTAPSSTGTGSGSGTSSSSPTTTFPSISNADFTFCVSETNRYRAMKGRAALTQSASLEAFANEGARSDGLANVPHQHVTTKPPAGFWAENEVLRWPYNIASTTSGVIAQAIASFWSEGPGGGHYENLIGPFTILGCGAYVDANGLTIVLDFQ